MNILTLFRRSCHFKPWYMWLLPTRARLCTHSDSNAILSFTHTVLDCLTQVLPGCTLGNLQVLEVILAPACGERELIRAADSCLHADFSSRQAAVTQCAVNRHQNELATTSVFPTSVGINSNISYFSPQNQTSLSVFLNISFVHTIQIWQQKTTTFKKQIT